MPVVKTNYTSEIKINSLYKNHKQETNDIFAKAGLFKKTAKGELSLAFVKEMFATYLVAEKGMKISEIHDILNPKNADPKAKEQIDGYYKEFLDAVDKHPISCEKVNQTKEEVEANISWYSNLIKKSYDNLMKADIAFPGPEMFDSDEAFIKVCQSEFYGSNMLLSFASSFDTILKNNFDSNDVNPHGIDALNVYKMGYGSVDEYNKYKTVWECILQIRFAINGNVTKEGADKASDAFKKLAGALIVLPKFAGKKFKDFSFEDYAEAHEYIYELDSQYGIGAYELKGTEEEFDIVLNNSITTLRDKFNTLFVKQVDYINTRKIQPIYEELKAIVDSAPIEIEGTPYTMESFLEKSYSNGWNKDRDEEILKNVYMVCSAQYKENQKIRSRDAVMFINKFLSEKLEGVDYYEKRDALIKDCKRISTKVSRYYIKAIENINKNLSDSVKAEKEDKFSKAREDKLKRLNELKESNDKMYQRFVDETSKKYKDTFHEDMKGDSNASNKEFRATWDEYKKLVNAKLDVNDYSKKVFSGTVDYEHFKDIINDNIGFKYPKIQPENHAMITAMFNLLTYDKDGAATEFLKNYRILKWTDSLAVLKCALLAVENVTLTGKDLESYNLVKEAYDVSMKLQEEQNRRGALTSLYKEKKAKYDEEQRKQEAKERAEYEAREKAEAKEVDIVYSNGEKYGADADYKIRIFTDDILLFAQKASDRYDDNGPDGGKVREDLIKLKTPEDKYKYFESLVCKYNKTYEYREDYTTFLPIEIRNSGNKHDILDYYARNQRHMDIKTKAYIVMRLHSLNLAEELSKNPNKEVKRPVNVDEFGKVTIDNTLSSKQTSRNGCWSCCLEIMLKSHGIDVVQEDIRAYRPEYSADRIKSELFERDVDGKLSTDQSKDITEMSDAALAFAPNKMVRAFEIKKPSDTTLYRPFGDEIDFNDYCAKAAEEASDRIRRALKEDKCGIAFTTGNHYYCITSINDDYITCVNPSTRRTEELRLSTVIKNLFSMGANAQFVWMSNIELDKDGETLINVPSNYLKLNKDGSYKMPPEDVIEDADNDKAPAENDGFRVRLVGGVDDTEYERINRNPLDARGLLVVEQAYMPKKLNVAALKERAKNRSDEEYADLHKSRSRMLGPIENRPKADRVIVSAADRQKAIDKRANDRKVKSKLAEFAKDNKLDAVPKENMYDENGKRKIVYEPGAIIAFRLVKAYEAYDKLFTFLNDKYPNKLAAWKTRHDNVKKEYQKVMDKLKKPENAIADNEARSWAYPLDYYFKKEEDAYEALLVLTSINNNISMRELGTVPYKSVVLYDDDYDPSLLASFAENIRMFAEEHVEFNMLEACDMYWQYNYAVQYALTMPTTDVKTLTTTRLSVKDSDSPLKDYFEFSGRFAKTHVEGKLGNIPAGLRAINAASEKVASKKDLPFLMDYVAKNPAKAIEILPKPKNDMITRAKVEEPKPVPAPEVKVEDKKEEVKVEVKPEVKVEAPKKEEVKPEVKVEEPIIIDTSVPKHIINQPNVEELKPSVLDEYYREKYTLANSTIKYFKEWKAKIIAEITEERDSLGAAADNEHNDVKTYLDGYGALLTTLKATDRRLDTMAVALKEFYDKTAKCLKVKRRLISDEHLESAKKMNKRTHEFIMGLGTILSGFAASNLCDPEYGYTFAELTEVKIEECIENFKKEIGCEADVIDDNHVKTVATDIDKASAKQSLLIKEIEKKYGVKADLEAKTPDRWLETKDKMSTEDYAKLVYFTDVIERIRDLNVVRHSENFDEIKNEVLNKSVVKKKVAALTKNPVFKAVAKANPDETYSAWKTVEEDARNMKDDFINALGDYRKPTLGDYIMYGECAEDVVKERDELLKSDNLTPAQYKQEMKNILGKYDPISAQQMADDAAGYEAKYEAKCYHRLALITTMKLLSNDSNEVILQGVAAGQYEISSIVEKVQEHLESKKFISDNMMKFGITQMNLDLDGKKYYDDIMKSVVKQMKAENAAKIEVRPNMAGVKKNAPNAPSM